MKTLSCRQWYFIKFDVSQLYINFRLISETCGITPGAGRTAFVENYIISFSGSFSLIFFHFRVILRTIRRESRRLKLWHDPSFSAFFHAFPTLATRTLIHIHSRTYFQKIFIENMYILHNLWIETIIVYVDIYYHIIFNNFYFNFMLIRILSADILVNWINIKYKYYMRYLISNINISG